MIPVVPSGSVDDQPPADASYYNSIYIYSTIIDGENLSVEYK